MGSPALLSEIRLNKTYPQIRERWDIAEPTTVLEVLDGKNENGKPKYGHRTYLELALALALVWRGLAEIIQDGPRPGGLI